MRIAIEENVLSNKLWHPVLDTLLMFVEEDRHGFDAAYAPNLLGSPWIAERQSSARDLITLSVLKRSTDSLIDSSLVLVDAECPRGGNTDFEGSTTRLHPLDAIFFLSMPFQVILENEYFDGAFLLWMAKALDFMRFVEAYRAGKFAFRHAGGKDSIERSAKTFSSGVWGRSDGRYCRAFRLWTCAVLDNDARHDKDFPNRKIISATTPHVSFIYQLSKRSIESYIPSEFLRKILKNRQAYALERLSTEQRRFFHMKKGFRFERNDAPTLSEYRQSKNISIEEKKLFSNIQQADWQELRSGFGGGLSKIFTEQEYRPNVNDLRLSALQDREEILRLLKLIYERI